VTVAGTELGPKKLELLRELVPTVKTIALLVNLNNRVQSEADIRIAQDAAQRLGLEVIVVNGGSESEIEMAFAAAANRALGRLCWLGCVLQRSPRTNCCSRATP
jgi:hypothetical protein